MNYATCTKVQDKMWQQSHAEPGEGGKKLLRLRAGGKIAHTVNIKTIKYR